MAFNTQLTQMLTGVGLSDAITTGSSVLSLSSQILKKTMYYITNGTKTDTSRGIEGFLFDVTKETVVNLTSDITDYPMEGDYKIQAHFSKHPVSISITGTCSDLRVHDPNDNWNIEKILDDATEMMEKLSYISTNLQLGGAARECERVVSYMKSIDALYRKIKEVVNRLNQIRRWFGKDFGQDDTTSQKRAYDTLYNHWVNGDILHVETPWTVYDKCVIERLSFTQPENTTHQTEISVQFKQITTIDEVSGLYRGILNEQVYTQMAEEVKKTNGQPNVSGSALEEGAETLGKTDEDMKDSIKKYPKNPAKKQGILNKGKNRVDNASTKKR